VDKATDFATGHSHTPDAEEDMMATPLVCNTVDALRATVAAWRKAGDTVALVPTMGALHDGHIALVELARRKARRVVVSIFVNPTQFAPHEDFTKYPRTLERDAGMLADAQADAIYAPAAAEIYPEGFATRVLLLGPAAAGLEDRFRPTHFEGVATICCKLFTQCQPDIAVFGEKDYQQLQVVTRMARDLDLPLAILGLPTIREKDGLAMSSRNRYLSAADRAKAPLLHQTLQETAERIRSGTPVAGAVAIGQARIMDSGFELDYLEGRHAHSLAPVAALADGPVRLLLAARIGGTRLIDNIPV
jgi:pantoate--beta-alanine ligase